MREFVHSLSIKASPAAVLDAFFDAEALAQWWDLSRAVCVPRPFGSYAVEWKPTEWRDDLLGRLGGVFHGTVVDFTPGQEFFLADLYWQPPDGDPIGPMALEARCRQEVAGTLLFVRQSGHEETNERWTRYYDVMSSGWLTALHGLKRYLEQRPRQNRS